MLNKHDLKQDKGLKIVLGAPQVPRSKGFTKKSILSISQEAQRFPTSQDAINLKVSTSLLLFILETFIMF